MTDQKKLKRAVRARSEKTGESYTSARRQVLAARAARPDRDTLTKNPADPAPSAAEARPPVAVPPAPVPSTPQAKGVKGAPAQRGEVTDATARRQTGHGLDHWFAVLERFGAAAKGHTASARYLHDSHGVPGWYAQGITVAYERQHGLREVNQACTGGFQVSVTKTIPAPLAQVARAFSDARVRKAWLAGADPDLAQALHSAFTGPKAKELKLKGEESGRLRYRWGAGTMEIRLTAKATGTTVAADSMNLDDAAAVEPRRAQWKVALEALRAYFAS